MVETTHGWNILLVDDEVGILEVMSTILRKKGYLVSTAQTGRMAIDKIRHESFDVALIDIRLSDVNGLDLLRMIKAVKPSVKRIVLTGDVLSQETAKSLLEDVDGMLTKPCTAQELFEVLQKAMES